MFTSYQKCHRSQIRKLVFSTPSGLKKVLGEEVKLASLSLLHQVKKGEWGSQASKLVFTTPSGLKRVSEEVKLVSLSLLDQVVWKRWVRKSS